MLKRPTTFAKEKRKQHPSWRGIKWSYDEEAKVQSLIFRLSRKKKSIKEKGDVRKSLYNTLNRSDLRELSTISWLQFLFCRKKCSQIVAIGESFGSIWVLSTYSGRTMMYKKKYRNSLNLRYLRFSLISSELSFRVLYAEREGFEPPVPLGTAVFKTAVIDHSTISPDGISKRKSRNEVHTSALLR